MGILRPLVLCAFAAVALSACVYGGPYPAGSAYYGSYSAYGAYPAYNAYPGYGAYPGHYYGGHKSHKGYSNYGYGRSGGGCRHCGW